MAKYKIMLTDTIYTDTSIEMSELEKIDAEIIRPRDISTEALIEAGKDCDGILCDYASINAEVIAGLEKCKIIVEAGIGVNNIDLKTAANKGIMVANVPHYCLNEVADHAMALFLANTKKIVQYNFAVKNGKWDRLACAPIYRLATQNFCLFGFGGIARKVAKRAQAFEMTVYALDPYLPKEVFEKQGVKKVDKLEELAAIADVLSIHAPLTPETQGVINKKIFDVMKSNCILINTSRGGLICEKDLIKALQNKKLMAAGLDVQEHEPPLADNPMLKMDNVIMTPHSGFFSTEAEVELRRTMAREVVLTLTEGHPTAWVNKRYFTE